MEHEYSEQSYSKNGNNNDDKAAAIHMEALVQERSRLEPPELVKAMTPEQRAIAEQKLKRKIDLRLLPMLVVMYIMNYLG